MAKMRAEGVVVPRGVTRGEAAVLIAARFERDPAAHEASRRAQAIRKRAGGSR